MFALASDARSSSGSSSQREQQQTTTAAAAASVVSGDETAVSVIDEGDVTLVTSMGDVEIELYWRHAPRTCRNFFELAKTGYYDNSTFHRIVRDFCIQGGDPTGTGRGGKSIYGDTFADEIHPELRHTGAGVVSMANAGLPNTNTSQFFILLSPSPSLDGKNTIFGRVKRGMENVKKMSSVQTTATHKPIHDIKIIRASTALSIDASI